jgi:hypothetical protein
MLSKAKSHHSALALTLGLNPEVSWPNNFPPEKPGRYIIRTINNEVNAYAPLRGDNENTFLNAKTISTLKKPLMLTC